MLSSTLTTLNFHYILYHNVKIRIELRNKPSAVFSNIVNVLLLHLPDDLQNICNSAECLLKLFLNSKTAFNFPLASVMYSFA